MPGCTLADSLSITGVGLHTGQLCTVELRPGQHGLRFVGRTDPQAPAIAAHVDAIVDTRLATTLGVGARRVQTVEHLLSAAMGLGLTDLDVAVDGSELPILDGTAGAWAQAMLNAGLIQTQASVPRLVIDAPVRITDGDGWMLAEPADRLELSLTIDFAHPLIGQQSLCWSQDDDFMAVLGDARTFGFERDVTALQAQGLIAGGSLDNAVVFSQTGVLNPGGLRSPDEPVRHKAMDMLGDLALLGHPVQGRISGHRPGHGRVIALVRAILAQPSAWHLQA